MCNFLKVFITSQHAPFFSFSYYSTKYAALTISNSSYLNIDSKRSNPYKTGQYPQPQNKMSTLCQLLHTDQTCPHHTPLVQQLRHYTRVYMHCSNPRYMPTNTVQCFHEQKTQRLQLQSHHAKKNLVFTALVLQAATPLFIVPAPMSSSSPSL